MKMKTDVFIITACCVIATAGSFFNINRNVREMKNNDVMDAADFSVYYDVETNEDLLEKGKVRGTLNRRKCMKEIMKVEEASEVCQNRSKWKKLVSAYLARKEAKVKRIVVEKSRKRAIHQVTIKDMMPRPWYTPGWLLRLPFTGGRCSCENLKCSCCTGIRINALNFDRKTCAMLTYDPSEFTIDLEVKMNNDSVYRKTYSARNPPPFCIPVVVPYLPPGLVDMCVMLFDVTLQQNKLHICMDMNTRIDKAPVVILHFDCMDMGLGGVSLSKPGSSQTTPSGDTEPEQLNGDIYDPVIEESPETTPTVFNNSIKYI